MPSPMLWPPPTQSGTLVARHDNALGRDYYDMNNETRFKIFLDNVRYIDADNTCASAGYRLGITPFTGLTPQRQGHLHRRCTRHHASEDSRLLRLVLSFCRHLYFRERHQDRRRQPRTPVRATSDQLHAHRCKQGLPRRLRHGGMRLHHHERSVLKELLSIHRKRQWQLPRPCPPTMTTRCSSPYPANR
jgi:hypothetical protein